jgi:hypothetical protein
MEILPPTSPPPAEPRQQRHAPTEASDYTQYRACLRWDAGFTCSFCLLHETDLSTTGVEGTGLTWIEHIEPRSHAPALTNVYSNCAYSCRFCNNTRRNQPVVHASGARLLHPWLDPWGAHFRLQNDRLEAMSDGASGRDAHYTARVYRVNDPRRVELRRQRREFIEDRMRLLDSDPAELRQLAARQASTEDRLRILALARKLGRSRAHALDELRARTAVPRDAPTACRCGSQAHHALPPGMIALYLE